MPDITMCNWELCPMRDKCIRFTAKPDKLWQSYFTDVPIKDGKCEYFWDNKNINKEIFNDDDDFKNMLKWF